MLKRLVRAVVGGYELYRIYRSPHLQRDERTHGEPAFLEIVEIHDPRDWAQSQSEDLRALATFCGSESLVLAVRSDDRLVSGAAVWYGDRYRQCRGFWPLNEREAKLVQVTTSHDFRGKGLAPMLIHAVERRLAERGFDRLYARIWHNHHSSLRAFQKLGWSETAFVIVCHPFNRKVRFQIPTGRN
jgi:GNAT superfamily N-acetyltransferase